MKVVVILAVLIWRTEFNKTEEGPLSLLLSPKYMLYFFHTKHLLWVMPNSHIDFWLNIYHRHFICCKFLRDAPMQLWVRGTGHPERVSFPVATCRNKNLSPAIAGKKDRPFENTKLLLSRSKLPLNTEKKIWAAKLLEVETLISRRWKFHSSPIARCIFGFGCKLSHLLLSGNKQFFKKKIIKELMKAGKKAFPTRHESGSSNTYLSSTDFPCGYLKLVDLGSETKMDGNNN